MKNKSISIVIVLVAVLALSISLYSLTNGSFNFLSFASTSSNCGVSISNVQCAGEVGGTITSLENVYINSNFGPLNGEVYLVNLALTGAGQYLTGSFNATASQIAKQINANATSNNQYIQINAKLNSQNLVIPYTYFSGAGLDMQKINPVIFNFSWFSDGAGLLTTCAQIPQSGSFTSQYSPTYQVSCFGPSSITDYNNVLSAYNGRCVNSGGATFLVSQNKTSVFGSSVTWSSAIQVECLSLVSTQVGQVYQSGSPSIAENVSVFYSNSTFTKTLYLSSTVPTSSYDNILLAQIYGYNIGSLNTYIGTEAPTLIVDDGTVYITNYATTQDIQSIDQISSSAYQPAIIGISGNFNYIYNLNSLQNAVSQQQNNVNAFLQSKLQSDSPYGNIQVVGANTDQQLYAGTYSGAPYYGVVNVTSSPVVIPEIQMIVKASSLNMQIPVAYPKLESANPNPIDIQSGSNNTETFSVYNNASIGGAAYIAVYAQNGTKVAQTPNFNIGAQSTVEEPVSLFAYNPYLANLKATWTVVAYSTENPSIQSSITFGVNVRPNCPSGSIYVNNSNCKNEVHKCSSGYVYNQNTQQCSLLCSPPSVFNASSQSCFVPPIQSGIVPIWMIIVLIIIIIIAIYVVMHYKSGSKRVRMHR
jgi:hypothetical protein